MPGPSGVARPPPATGDARRQRAPGRFGPTARPLGQGQDPAGSGFLAMIRPLPVRPGPAKRTRTRFWRRRGGGLFDAAGPGHAVPGGTFVLRKIPPACAPSGDAPGWGPSVACRVTQTCTDRRHREWLLARSAASRPALPPPPPSTPRSSMTDDARPAGRDRKAPADLYGMRGPRRRAHPIPPHLRWPGPRRRCGRALVLWQGGQA